MDGLLHRIAAFLVLSPWHQVRYAHSSNLGKKLRLYFKNEAIVLDPEAGDSDTDSLKR